MTDTTTISAIVLAHTRRTVQSYEGFAPQYDALGDQPSAEVEDALRRLVQCVPLGARVLAYPHFFSSTAHAQPRTITPATMAASSKIHPMQAR